MLLIVLIRFIGIQGQSNNFFDQRDLDYVPVPNQRGPKAPWANPNFAPKNRPPAPKYKPKEYYDDDYPGPPLEAFNRYEQIRMLKNIEDNERGFGSIARDLLKDASLKRFDKTINNLEDNLRNNAPSPGMSMYWPEEEKTPLNSPGRSGPTRVMPQEAIIDLAIKNLRNLDKSDDKMPPRKQVPVEMSKLPVELAPPQQYPIIPTTKKPGGRPIQDDFGSPILWVPINAKETGDGLAKVTDPKTGKNLQYVINGTVFVPVIDYSMERLGLRTTTPPLPKLTTDVSALRTVAKNIDIENIDKGDWLAFEVAAGGRKVEDTCTDNGCQARCNRLGCESTCRGDTCAAGCVGGSCSTFCKGPGCLAMCIGEGCSARCEGVSCEARCRGEDCEAGCRTFSCRYLQNGVYHQGGGSWSQHYPQYDVHNIREPSQYNM